MGYKIVLTELAAGDLDSITEYIAGRLANPPGAAALHGISAGGHKKLCDDLPRDGAEENGIRSPLLLWCAKLRKAALTHANTPPLGEAFSS